jgi:ABC-type glycerol-3-phosphate transport system substrate-binding protein
MLFYREDIWNEAGVDPTQIRLWSDYLAAGKSIASYKFADGKKRYLGYVEPAPGINTTLVAQTGGQLFDPKTDAVVFDTDPGFRTAFDFQVELSRAGSSLKMQGWTPSWFQSMGTGVIASYVTESWWPNILQQDVPGSAGKWRAMECPAFTAGGGRDAIDGAAVTAAVNKPGADTTFIWRYMQNMFLNTPVTVSLMNQFQQPAAYMPALLSPALNYNQASPYFGGQRMAAIDLSIQKHARALHVTPQYAFALTAIQTALGDVIAGHKSASAALKAAADKARSAS